MITSSTEQKIKKKMRTLIFDGDQDTFFLGRFNFRFGVFDGGGGGGIRVQLGVHLVSGFW